MSNLYEKIYYNLVNKLYPVMFGLYHNYGCNRKCRANHIVVSLTTIPSRINIVHLCINQLLRQTLKPDKVILYLAKENFKGMPLPDKLLALQKRGLDIVWVDEDLNCHKKYFYAMAQYPRSIVITVDDDVFYSKKLVAKLMESYKKYPRAVSAMRVHKIRTDDQGRIHPYSSWNHNYRDKDALIPSHRFMATGCGGVLYPPGILYKDLLDREKIETNCLFADDIWLKWMELLSDTKVVLAVKHEYAIWSIEGSQKQSLNKSNVGENKNDLYVQKMLTLYPNAPIRYLLQ